MENVRFLKLNLNSENLSIYLILCLISLFLYQQMDLIWLGSIGLCLFVVLDLEVVLRELIGLACLIRLYVGYQCVLMKTGAVAFVFRMRQEIMTIEPVI